MWHSMAANPSAVDRVGAVVRSAPWWLHCEGNLTSHHLTPRPVPRATFDVLHPASKPLFRHVAEGMEDEMALEKQLWTQRAALHTGHTQGLSTARLDNSHVTDYVGHAARVRAELQRDAERGQAKL